MGAGSVLVVDDEPGIVDMVTWTLEDAGYDVLTASNGVAALDTVYARHPDLLITDIAMPEMDGLELCRRLRENPFTEQLPIIIMSARTRLQTTGFPVPVDARLAKPFTLDDLLALVTRWMPQSLP